eukprot:PITA_24379
MKASLMYAPDCQKDFNLYLAAADTTIAMVLVQEDNEIENPIYYLSQNLNDTEMKYSYIEKLALATVQAIQRFPHYVLFRKTAISSYCNPMTCILLQQLLGGKYSKWIAILQEFDLEFKKSKSKKALVFMELPCDLPSPSNDATSEEAIVDENLFLISSSNPWRLWGASIYLFYDIKDFTSRILLTNNVQRLHNPVKSCHACQIFDSKTRRPPAPLQLVAVAGPFAKWGIYFMTCNPTSAGGHGYIIVAVDYFTKWAEAMPTLKNNGETTALFFFNHVVSRFDVPQAIVTDHGLHFRNHMMVELASKLGMSHDSSTPYYPQANRQVEAINKVLKRMLQRMIGVHKWSWHLILYSALWA